MHGGGALTADGAWQKQSGPCRQPWHFWSEQSTPSMLWSMGRRLAAQRPSVRNQRSLAAAVAARLVARAAAGRAAAGQAVASRMAARGMASGRKKAGAATIARARTIWCRGRQLQQPGRAWKQSQAAEREAALRHDFLQESSRAANKPSELTARTAELHIFTPISRATSQRNSAKRLTCLVAGCACLLPAAQIKVDPRWPNRATAMDRARRGASAGRPSPRQLARPGQDGALQAHMRVFTKQPVATTRGAYGERVACTPPRVDLLTDPHKRLRHDFSRIGYTLPPVRNLKRASTFSRCAGEGHDPHRGRCVGEASNPGPPSERTADTPQRARALHALAQMRPDAPSPAGTIVNRNGLIVIIRHAIDFFIACSSEHVL